MTVEELCSSMDSSGYSFVICKVEGRRVIKMGHVRSVGLKRSEVMIEGEGLFFDNDHIYSEASAALAKLHE